MPSIMHQKLKKYYLILYHYHSPSSRNIRITLRSKQSNYFSSSLLLTLLTRIPAQKIFFIFSCAILNSSIPSFTTFLTILPLLARFFARYAFCAHSPIRASRHGIFPWNPVYFTCAPLLEPNHQNASTFWCHFAKGTPYCGATYNFFKKSVSDGAPKSGVPMFYPKDFRDFSLTGTAFCPGFPKCESGSMK